MATLPSGTVTFLFTDIEGSTSRWETAPDKMRGDLALHNAVLDGVMEEFGGAVFKTVGDAYCVAFSNAERAVAAAVQAQIRLGAEVPSLKVRMGLHTGSVDPTGDDYFGQPVNRAARIMALASGGQILASEATKSLLPTHVPLRDLGPQLLKDLTQPVHIWQVGPGEFNPLRGLGAIHNNLPLQTTSFVGRETELLDLRSLLSKSRLVTLTGTGGTGKSRLSLQLVAENIDRFPDGAWLVELAALPDREDVLREVVGVIGAGETSSGLLERIAVHFRHRTSCLILDNCEHVLPVAADLAEKLIGCCPDLTVLATSREPLGVAGEAVYRVPSLSAPALDRHLSLREIDRFGACALFVERLASAAPDYGLDDDDALTIAKICTRLDGIPLALELAAARGRAMRLDQVEERLDDRFRLLTGGRRNALSRQQTLQALIDWSVQLLNETERRLFASLSVFAGGWRLEAAEALCGCEALGIERWEVLDLMTALVDKSLVIFDHVSGRYRMLESLRQYALDLMARCDWANEVRNRHADFFIEAADPKVEYVMVLPEEKESIFASEYENIRAALEWSRGDAVRAAKGARVAAALWPGFLMLERSGELVRQLEPLIEAAGSVLEPSERDRLRVTLAVACARAEDGRALGIIQDLRGSLDSLPPLQRSYTATSLGYTLFRAGRMNEAVDVLSPLVALKAGIDNHYYAYIFTMLGLARACLGQFDQAEADSERACRELLLRDDYRGWVAAKTNLALIAVIRGRYVEAVRHAIQQNVVSTTRRVNLKARAMVLAVFAAAALDDGDKDLAALLFGGGHGTVREEFDPNDPLDNLFVNHLLKMFKSSFDPARLQELTSFGRRHDWEPWFQAILDLDPESLVFNGRFQVPFPELILSAAESRLQLG